MKITINLKQIQKNLQKIREQLTKDILCCAVIKSNSYGLGIKKISPYLNKLKIHMLAVSDIQEAEAILSTKANIPILILKETPHTTYEKIVQNNLIQTVYNLKTAKNILIYS